MVQGLIGQNPEGRRLPGATADRLRTGCHLGAPSGRHHRSNALPTRTGVGRIGDRWCDHAEVGPRTPTLLTPTLPILPLRGVADRLGPVHCHVAGHQPFHGDFGRRVALGLRPARAAEFSFLLGLPTLGGACVYKLLKDGDTVLALGTPSLVVGILVATVSATFAVRWLVGFLTNRGLAPFGWYRLALTVVVAAAWASGWIELDASSGDASSTP